MGDLLGSDSQFNATQKIPSVSGKPITVNANSSGGMLYNSPDGSDPFAIAKSDIANTETQSGGLVSRAHQYGITSITTKDGQQHVFGPDGKIIPPALLPGLLNAEPVNVRSWNQEPGFKTALEAAKYASMLKSDSASKGNLKAYPVQAKDGLWEVTGPDFK